MMSTPPKYSKEWYGNKAYQDALAGKKRETPHDGPLDRMGGISEGSRQKRDTYNDAFDEGKLERERRR
jgi:hypothetical protein